MANCVGSPWAWRNRLSAGTASCRFTAPPFLPLHFGIMKIGRNATAFLENAADKRRMRTAWGSVHGKIKLWIEMRLGKLPLEVCFLLRGRVPVKSGDEVENSDQIAAETGKPGRF